MSNIIPFPFSRENITRIVNREIIFTGNYQKGFWRVNYNTLTYEIILTHYLNEAPLNYGEVDGECWLCIVVSDGSLVYVNDCVAITLKGDSEVNLKVVLEERRVAIVDDGAYRVRGRMRTGFINNLISY